MPIEFIYVRVSRKENVAPQIIENSQEIILQNNYKLRQKIP